MIFYDRWLRSYVTTIALFRCNLGYMRHLQARNAANAVSTIFYLPPGPTGGRVGVVYRIFDQQKPWSGATAFANHQQPGGSTNPQPGVPGQARNAANAVSTIFYLPPGPTGGRIGVDRVHIYGP